MIINKLIFLLALLLIITSCSKKVKEESVIKEKSLELQVLEAYKEGKDTLESGDALFAAKKFNEAEILFPQSVWAPKSALMAAYSYYIQDYYGDAIAELERFIRVYPKHENLDYVYFLLAISYYEQIVDEKKDLGPLIEAKKYFEIILEKYPKSEFAYDAEYKLELIIEMIAAKEMYLGRYYLEKEKWIAAMNRFKNVVENYDKTIYIEEALFRLVEIHYKLGMIDESKKFAKLLGYNYQSSEWYLASYKIFNKDYKKIKKIEKSTKVSLVDKLKSLID